MATITIEFLQDLLKEEYPDVLIQEYEGAPGSKRGDNYTSMVYRIHLKGIRKYSEPDGSAEISEPWEGSIIYKCLPECEQRREAYKSDELFRNEVAFYKKIWPKMVEFQNQWQVARPFKAIPKCYLARNDLVILKDLKPLGFVMPDRRQVLTIEQSYFVLKHIAQFHALSLAMKCHDPEGFYELLNSEDGITEVFYNAQNAQYYKVYYTEAINNAIRMVEEELEGSPDKEIYLEKFRSCCHEELFFDKMVSIVAPKEPLAVISHGDCWTNNLLFRYVDGEIAEMYIVDFQIARYGSPAHDLAFIIYLCMDRQQRAEHLPSLLEYYTDELHRRMVEMSDGSSFPDMLDRDTLFEMIQDEFRKCSHFAMGISLDMFPILTCDSDEAPDVYQGKDDSDHEPTKPVWTNNAACRKKMTDLLIELVDEGLL